MAIATHLDHVAVPMLLPGISVTTTPDDYSVINMFQIQRFDGTRWNGVGKTMSGD